MKTVNEIMREFYGEYKMAAYKNKKYTWNDMVKEEKYYAKFMGHNKVKVYRMNQFTNGLKEHFGEDKMKVLVGTIGKLDYCTLTGYVVMNEDFIKNNTVEAVKADIEELYEEDKFED